MRRALVHPLFWLTLIVGSTLILRGATVGFEPQRVPDTRSYEIAADFDNFPQRLAYYRSLGYPFFLNLVSGLGLSPRSVPTVQIALYLVSIYVFWWGVRRFSNSGWLAFAAALPLPWAAVMDLANRVQPDFLSAAATLAAVGGLLALAREPRSPWLWLAVTIAVISAYHLRPAAVFLVGFVPILGGICYWFWNQRSAVRTARFVLLLAVATLAPYWGYCTVRWVTVHHFGLVSFGGTNLAGLAANFISGGLIPELPQEHRRLAKRMLQLRRRIGWSPMRPGDRAEPFFAQYSDNIWKVANPASRFELRKRNWELERRRARNEIDSDRIELWQRQPPAVARNTITGAMSKAVIQRRSVLYFQWVKEAQLYGLRQLTDYVWIVGPFVIGLLSLPILFVRRHRATPPTNDQGVAKTARAGPSERESLIVIALLGIGFFFGYLFLVSLVSFPFTRYFQSMILFLPSMLATQVFALWREILQPDSV